MGVLYAERSRYSVARRICDKLSSQLNKRVKLIEKGEFGIRLATTERRPPSRNSAKLDPIRFWNEEHHSQLQITHNKESINQNSSQSVSGTLEWEF